MGIFFKSKNKDEYLDKQRNKTRLIVIGIFILAIIAGSLDYPALWNKASDYINNQTGIQIPHFKNVPFRLGLDLQGGTHLIYKADLSDIDKEERQESMEGIRDVIERRVNMFGVTEPIVQINKSDEAYRLIVELPGVKDIHQAIEMIGATPYLEFKEERSQQTTEQIIEQQEQGNEEYENIDPYFKPTDLTGRYLKNAELAFDQTTTQPYVVLEFNETGADLFAQITKQNVGKRVAIYLDGAPISVPRVEQEIAGGRAQITGNFTIEEAKQLAQRLNAGALPVPIELISQQSIGASLGEKSLNKSLEAAIIGLIAVALFMIIYYRLPGILAVIALAVYTIFVLAIFKLIPVTLTLAGIAGFILSIGMAVDANVLIFERVKEERKKGRDKLSSIDEGLKRAWPSIRDGNLSTIITAVILYWFGTSIVRGFALTLLVGVLISMFTAIILTRHLLKLTTKS
ncbi:MAG: protein translocase subunit SecD [Candidatus Portnoybacteria bacterium]|nr:protein translocase subunit SecD [Candidatus Portnoybacteria bacterium]